METFLSAASETLADSEGSKVYTDIPTKSLYCSLAPIHWTCSGFARRILVSGARFKRNLLRFAHRIQVTGARIIIMLGWEVVCVKG